MPKQGRMLLPSKPLMLIFLAGSSNGIENKGLRGKKTIGLSRMLRPRRRHPTESRRSHRHLRTRHPTLPPLPRSVYSMETRKVEEYHEVRAIFLLFRSERRPRCRRWRRSTPSTTTSSPPVAAAARPPGTTRPSRSDSPICQVSIESVQFNVQTTRGHCMHRSSGVEIVDFAEVLSEKR